MENWRGKHDEDVEVGGGGSSTLVQRGEILPLEQILQSESVPPERRGTILKTELDHERHHYVYEVKSLDQNGIVWKMQFDAKTSMLLRDEQDY